MNEIGATAASSKKTKTAITATVIAEEPTGFYIDTKPLPVQDSSISTNDIAVEHPSTGILGEDIGKDDDDEIIVYVTPYP